MSREAPGLAIQTLQPYPSTVLMRKPIPYHIIEVMSNCVTHMQIINSWTLTRNIASEDSCTVGV